MSYVMVMYNHVKQCKCNWEHDLCKLYTTQGKANLERLVKWQLWWQNVKCCGVPMTKQLKLHSKTKWLTIIEWYQTNKNHMLVYYDWKSNVKWWGMYGYNQTMNFWNPHNQLMDLWKLAKMQYKSCYS